MGLLALSALIVAGTGFYLFARTLPNLSVNQKKVHKDLQIMQEELSDLLRNPVPIHKKDLDVLSYNIARMDRKKRFTKRVKGVITSIFEEEMVGFYYRRYNKKDALLFARTKDQSFYFWEKGDNARVVIAEQAVGSYHYPTGVLKGAQSGQPIAEINKRNTDRHPFLIQGREVASVKLLQETDLLQRFFDYTAEELSREEQAILIALSVFEIVKSQVTPS